jgi:biopolymer transport protein ExbB
MSQLPDLILAQANQSTLWEQLAAGGWAMWPLLACSLGFFYLCAHGWLITRSSSLCPPSLCRQLEALLGSGNVQQALALAKPSSSALGRIMAAALQRWDKAHSRRFEAAEAAATEALVAQDRALGQPVAYLNLLAATTPMLGLLGTVSGMVGAFQTIATVGMGQPELLAGDIGQALVTTGTGLTIAIPSMAAYFLLQHRLERHLTLVAAQATELLHLLDGVHAEQPQPKGQQ